MELWVAVLLLALALVGLVLSVTCLRRHGTLRIVCIVLCALAVVLSAGYIGLTALFLDAASRR